MASIYHIRHLNGLLMALGFTGSPLSFGLFSSGPRFLSVADVLRWLALQCTGVKELPKRPLENADDRVAFVEQISELLARHASFCLDVETIYAAEGAAVKELIRLARTLLNAVQSAINRPALPATLEKQLQTISTSTAVELMPVSRGDCVGHSAGRPDGACCIDQLAMAAKLQQLNLSRSAASQLVDTAASLLQAFERHSRPERVILRRRVRDFLLRLGLHLDSGADQELEHIQLQLAEQLRRAKADLLDTQHACLDLENELTQDSDRAQKRLQSLQNLKPAFLEDHKKLMAELQETYDMYVACVRNERFLEMEAEKRQAKARAGLLEQQKVLQNIQQKMKDEAANLLACRFDRGTSDDEEEGQKESVNLARKRRSTRESQESKQEETENPFTASGRQLPAETSRRRRPQRRGNGETTERRSSDDVEFSEDMQGNGVRKGNQFTVAKR
ncbi:clusterin-associated protein 1 [Toxoplasma gondii TgCatPRC2]|uniref:Clusterin-associated protein 1 n=10 Tax=Toxoplasma gondii TaxID=5811 RepID=B9PY74_TOXGV|nr:hypothetical protein TGME49_293850 [Toxoplasma gondii ME49]EPR57600.1 hypothetical protein TGGT1_293850 [Toxoplasma gondii GT1]ESS29279.1 clusterin-associated protein 1 [Toxoplasma gondii VEG]KAF4646127.1 hypothetical protein TGRH88_019140 [Toxoplasma gondii]KFG35700.1 clusterin-associated protein 1 [Toxoplasma gondii p89]KFH14372.1 clusterin-associated protein 1 [Toxoplasma gondii MAS]KYF39794.1 clusterin-associated protein 1 [Toxoplasma gondii ARI]KYK65936.1 clusterin-associated protein|eukprot:XP_018638609.1 hypothetical protein TGME49_293850 [Toxoplasma gondii ME49]